jgi:hypothetical protein
MRGWWTGRSWRESFCSRHRITSGLGLIGMLCLNSGLRVDAYQRIGEVWRTVQDIRQIFPKLLMFQNFAQVMRFVARLIWAALTTASRHTSYLFRASQAADIIRSQLKKIQFSQDDFFHTIPVTQSKSYQILCCESQVLFGFQSTLSRSLFSIGISNSSIWRLHCISFICIVELCNWTDSVLFRIFFWTCSWPKI